MRAVGIDLGSRRIGVATSDSAGRMAMPSGVIERSDNPATDRAILAGRVAELGAEVVVVGHPLNLSGSSGQAASAARCEAVALATQLEVPVVLHDERLTTVEADRRRRSVPGGKTPGARSGRRNRRPTDRSWSSGSNGEVPIDALAAQVLLQSWLDRELSIASRARSGDSAPSTMDVLGRPVGESRGLDR